MAQAPTLEESKMPTLEETAGQQEDVKGEAEENLYHATMPASIRALTEEQREFEIRKMKRKIDTVIPPIIMLFYILNYLDRQNLAAAKLGGIMEDLNMTTVQFSTSIAILFCTYLPFQILSNAVITKVSRPGLYICCAVIAWGLVSGLTSLVQSYGAVLGVRLLLGFTEAVFFPGAIYMMSAWYTRSELGKRLALFYIGQQLGNGFGGLIAAGVLKMDGIHGIRGWRWLFIIEGSLTIGCGIICAFFLPEFPHNARMLTPLQRDLAVWRLQVESGAGEEQDDISTKQGLVLAFKDVKLWITILMYMLAQGMGSVTNFFPTIVKALNYSNTITLLITAPPYLFASVFFWVISWWSDRKTQIHYPMLLCMGISILAYIISLSTLSVGARYFAIMLLPAGAIGPQLLLYKSLMLHMSRPAKKRAAAAGLLNAIGATANVWGSYMWMSPPRFYSGFGPLLAFAVVVVALCFLYKAYCKHLNAELDRGEHVPGVTDEQVAMGWRFVGW